MVVGWGKELSAVVVVVAVAGESKLEGDGWVCIWPSYPDTDFLRVSAYDILLAAYSCVSSHKCRTGTVSLTISNIFSPWCNTIFALLRTQIDLVEK